eukprot:2142220-Rhodomonas_salina.4
MAVPVGLLAASLAVAIQRRATAFPALVVAVGRAEVVGRARADGPRCGAAVQALVVCLDLTGTRTPVIRHNVLVIALLGPDHQSVSTHWRTRRPVARVPGVARAREASRRVSAHCFGIAVVRRHGTLVHVNAPVHGTRRGVALPARIASAVRLRRAPWRAP